MKETASLKICVLGGRSFGKTSLLSSLIAVSGTKESGISALGDNQRKLAIYNDYKDGHGKLSATSWDDICKFRFKITGGGNRKWVVSFIDYPGEFFQKFFEDENSGILNGVLAKLKTSGHGVETKQEELSYGGETRNAKRIIKEILSADALIVLLPVDSERTEYKKLLTTFKVRLESLLQTIEERNPYIPVCLAINKSDMLENVVVEDLLERPVFAGFHNMLTRERGLYYFYQSVSAFGGNKANGLLQDAESFEDLRQIWDGKSEPQNVLPMLIRISEMAEEGRYKLFRERFGKASITAKTLKWPFLWHRVRGLGANKEEDRKYCVKNLAQCVVRLGVFTLISAFSLFCAISTVCSLNAWVCFSGYDKKLSSAEKSCNGDKQFVLSREAIKELSESRPRQLGRLVFFCNQKINDLKKRYENLEDDRNCRVFKSAQEDCSGLELCDRGDSMPVGERLKRFDARISRYQNATNEIFGSETRIAADGSLRARNADDLRVEERIVQLIGEESEGRQRMEEDRDFFEDLQKIHAVQEKDYCRAAEHFLEEYQTVKVHLKGKCDDVRSRLKELEHKLTESADAYLKDHADHPDSEDYLGRIDMAHGRIECVTNLLGQLSYRSTVREKYEGVKQNAKELIKELINDKPCYEALAVLREKNRSIVTGKVKRIHAFLQDYMKYERCEKIMASFRQQYSNELCRIQGECLNIVTNNYVMDNQPPAEKIRRIKNQIWAYQNAYDEYVIGSEEFLETEGRLDDLRKHLGEYESAKRLEDGFATDLKRVNDSDEKSFCREAEQFLEKYKNEREQFNVQYGKLEKAKEAREGSAKNKLQNYLDNHKDDEDSEDYQNRIRIANGRIAAIDAFVETIGLKSPFRGLYLELKSVDEGLVNDLKSDAPFYTALVKLHEQNQKEVTGKIRRVNAFLMANISYPRCERFWQSARKDFSNEVCRVQNECWIAVTNNSFDVPGITTGMKIARIEKQIKAFEKARDEYVIGSSEYRDAETSIKQLRETLVAAQKQNGCEIALTMINGSSYKGRLKALTEFLNTYKDNLTDKQKTEVEKLEKDAIKYWQDYQSTNEQHYAINDNDVLNVQKQYVDRLEGVYLALMEEFPPNSLQYAQLEQKGKELADRKQTIEHDLELESAFRALPSTNAVERCMLLNAIDAFELKYHDADYASKYGQKIFRQLARRKDEALRTFWSDYTNQISNVQCSPETNFLGRCQWADTCMKMTEEFCKGLSTNNVMRLRLLENHGNFQSQYLRFAKLSDLSVRADEIAGKLPTNDVRIACDRLSEIKNFYSSYPIEANQDPLAGECYSKVKNALEENDEVVSRYVDIKLEEMDGELPYGASLEMQLKVWSREMDLLGEYIQKFVENTNHHISYKQRLSDLNKRFDIAQRKDLFDKNHKQLRAELEYEPDMERRLQKIRGFLEKNDDVRLNDFARTTILALEKEAGRIEKDVEFKDYESRLDKTVKDQPSEDAKGQDFSAYKVKIENFQRQLENFKRVMHLKTKCQSVEDKLQGQLKYIEKAVGDGSWQNIKEKESEYKENPCADTAEKLRKALDSFDSVCHHRYADNVKATKAKFERYMKLRENVLTAKRAFLTNPQRDTLEAFQGAVNEYCAWNEGTKEAQGYKCQWPHIKKCMAYVFKFDTGVDVEFTKVEHVFFSRDWTRVSIKLGKSDEMSFVSDEFPYGIKKCLTEKISKEQDLNVTAKFKNYLSYNPAQTNVSIWQLVKACSNTGSGIVKVSFTVQDGDDKPLGIVELSVKGIPTINENE